MDCRTDTKETIVMDKDIKVLVIIPAYNEEYNIEKTICDFKMYARQFDYLIINDCSKDNTLKVLKQNGYNYIDLPVNLGIGGGVQTGYKYALQNNYDIAIQMDGDGQHSGEYLKTLIDPIINGKAEFVIGSRYIQHEGFQSSFLRRIGIKFLSFLIKACTGLKIYDVTSGFRAVNKRMISLFANEYAQDYPEPEAIVFASQCNASVLEVPVLMREREGGKSSIYGIKSIYFMIKVSLSIILLKCSLGKRKYGLKIEDEKNNATIKKE